ncbi:MAG: WbqC family protein [Bacteroidales bacterium]
MIEQMPDHFDQKGFTPLMSTAYLPPLDYMVVAARASAMVIDVHETYPKQTWRNRCRILTANGLLELSIPVHKPAGQQTRTLEAEISDHRPWQKRHWRSISSAYANAPYFLYYEDLIRPFFFKPPPRLLIDWNCALFNEMMGALGLNATIKRTAEFDKKPDPSMDFRFSFSPKTDKPQVFTQIQWPSYQQVFPLPTGFASRLSIIDLLFNVGPETGDYLNHCADMAFG